jgi:zinc transporter ZupT
MALLKIMTGFALGAEVLIFAMLPYFYTKAFSNKKLINAFNNFSAGLFLGIAFLHIIP